ncbi:alpha/beta hydrolase fold-domain-containing protein [Emericellopsis atlantica]|uniref:Alpha/beta hydrolase fold-domain-containing protein n=1 Tax=Emericellopsis atlantica TaxID=2614577 RepID=A0A9P7ZG60_9HYPO|nr:alpha/beta hydrolase fold-domain-containing protein [Emericellopsis atlantica]KAG9251499.1 alpha/beta hydrolase fold-domain-containing protein [Emericellopsis atlantica]
MTSTRMDPELLAHLGANPRLFNAPVSPLIVEKRHTITSFDGAALTIHEFKLAKDDVHFVERDPQPAFLFFHGGGMISCPVDTVYRPAMANFALEMGVRTFAVEYRLAPEHPHPTQPEDCYAATQWLSDNAASLSIDPARIGVVGDSAGGNIAAAVTLMARDRQLDPPLAKQMLIYPMLDDRARERFFDPKSARDQSQITFRDDFDQFWNHYLGQGRRGADDVSPYAAPGRAEDLRGLPSAYVEVGALDPFRDETMEYATRLARRDVEVELHVYAGVSHGFDIAGPKIGITRNAVENRRRAVQAM